ncbi:MAG: hypothetical protein R3C14_18780 [Caldilineaceae bacterium]
MPTHLPNNGHNPRSTYGAKANRRTLAQKPWALHTATEHSPAQVASRVHRLMLLLLLNGLLVLTACQIQPATRSHSGMLPAPSRGKPTVSGVKLTEATAAALRAPGAAWDLATGKLPTDQASDKLEFEAEQISAQPPVNELEGLGDGPLKRFNFFAAQRAYPLDTLPTGGYAKAVQQTQAMLPLQAAAALPQWQNIGPAPMRNSKMGQQPLDVSGRVLAIAVHPTNGDIVYIGTALGGVWKTTNGGQSWTPLTDNQPSLAIGALTLDPQNPNIVYAGTGEPTLGLDNYYGAGLLKSTDGGQSWTVLGANVFGGLGVTRIAVDPTDANVLYVATAATGIRGPATPPRGVYKSTDGGQSWRALATCSDCAGTSDLLLNPATPTTLYAGFYDYGIFRSTDGGESWQGLSNGLPSTDQVTVQRIILSMSKSNPAIIYASLHIIAQGQYDGALVFKTTDGGQSWSQIPTNNFNFCGNQCWYSHIIAVHPTNPNTLLLGGMADYSGETPDEFRIQRVVVRTDDGGQNWRDLTPNTKPEYSLHPDMHAIAFSPSNPQVIWVGNDGGIFRSTDGGATWQSRNTNLATLQFTGFAVDPRNDRIIQGGMQDNNKAFTLDGGATLGWTAADAGDGGFALIDPFNSTIWYGTRFGKSFQRNDQGSNNVIDWPYKVNGVNQQDPALFYMPIAADPSTAGVFYLGTYRLYRTANRGENWTPISDALGGEQGYLSAITVAPFDPKTIYVGTADGNVQVTRNTGETWTNIGAALPGRFVSRIAVAANNPQVAYVVFNGFNTHTPQQSGHIFKTTNGGGAWQDISGNLPDIPLLSLVLDHNHPSTIYVGSDTGVFQSTDDGRSWLPFNNGMPHVAVVDLAMNRTSSKLFAATHGRSVFRVTLAEEPTNTRSLFLPLVSNGQASGPTPTATPTSTPTATPTSLPTNTPTATPTEVQPEGTQFPTLTPSVTPTPTATPQPTRTPSDVTPTSTSTPDVQQFHDDFSDTASGWSTGTVGTCASNYVDLNNDSKSDVYGAQVLDFNQVCIFSAPSSIQINGAYQVYAGKESANDGSVYGLVFGLDDTTSLDVDSRFYVFWVDPFDQTYALQKFDQGNWTNLTGSATNGFVSSNAIGAGDTVNLLKVRREGASIFLFINNVFVYFASDNSFASFGFVGVANWAAYDTGRAFAGFDNFQVNRIAEVYRDDYSNDSSGWYVDASDICQAGYVTGLYRTATQPDYLCLYRSPAEAQVNGRFEATIRRGDSFYQTAYGLMIGENGNFTSYYALLIIPDIQAYALARYTEGQGWFALTWDSADATAWLFSDAINTNTSANQLRLERDHNLFRIWINDQLIDAYTDPAPLNGGYYGVINWSSEFETAIADFDNYNVTTWEAGGDTLAHAAAVNSQPGAATAPDTMTPLPNVKREKR